MHSVSPCLSFGRVSSLLGVALVAAGLAMAQPASAGITLWYNGDHNSSDSNSGSGTLNTDTTNGGGTTGTIFDDFAVTNSTGWNISSIWSNDFVYGSSYAGPATEAQWSIRSRMSSGNGGTVLFSGVSSAAQTDTGLTIFGTVPIYQTTVSGLDITLPQGTYWLQVTPVVSDGTGEEWYNANTNGLNAVGTPKGNDGNAFFNSPQLGYNYESTTVVGNDATYHDYSMGVAGVENPSPAPEPSQCATLGFCALGLGGLLVRARKRRGEAA